MKRNIKFQYFKLMLQQEENGEWGKKENFDFVSWIEYVKDSLMEQKSIELSDTKARIEKIQYISNGDVWVVRFMKLREENLPYLAKENKDAEDIPLDPDEYIGEDMYMLYDISTQIAMIQVNRFSLGLTRLTELFIKVQQLRNARILLNPISKNTSLHGFSRNMYRTIELGFANISQKLNSDKNNALNDIIKGFNKFSGVSGTIKISIGHSREDSLDVVECNELIQSLAENDTVVSAKVRVKDDDSSRVEVIDLFDDVFCDVLSFNLEIRQTLSFDYAAQSMVAIYNKSKDKIKKLITKVNLHN